MRVNDKAIDYMNYRQRLLIICMNKVSTLFLSNSSSIENSKCMF